METGIYIAIAILLYLAGLWTKNFLPTYMNEKGKNLATKEDIEIITKKIEDVKGEVQLLTHNRINYEESKRSALIELYESLHIHQNTLMSLKMNLDYETSQQDIKKFEQLNHELYFKLLHAEAKNSIYFSDDRELLDLILEIKTGHFDLDRITSDGMREIDAINYQIKIFKESNTNNRNLLDSFYSSRLEKLKEIHQEKLERFTPIAQLNAKLSKMVKSRIMQIEL